MGKIILSDCVLGMKNMDAELVDICVTSPPYNLNIKYGTYQDNKPRDSYLLWLNDVFGEIKRVLKPEGHFFLNMGYSNIDPWVGMDVANVARQHFVLQNNINWVKSIYVDGKTSGHFKPINSNRFSNPTWEHLFHFTKDGAVNVNKLGVGVPYEWKSNIDRFDQSSDLRCRGNSWFVPYDTISNRNKHRGSHPATFPVALAEMCIQFSGVSGLLLDPFMGSGTSGVAAVNQGLDYIGFDIDQNYIDFAEDRIADVSTFHKIFEKSS